MPTIDPHPYPLRTRLGELKRRFFWIIATFLTVFFVLYGFSDRLFALIAQPLADLLAHDVAPRRFIHTELAEAFMTHLKVAAFFAFILTWPMVAWQTWRFMSPGLYANEQRALGVFLYASPFLFVMGMAFAYYIVFPNTFRFFLSFEGAAAIHQLAVQTEAKLSSYLALTMRLFIVFGLCFQLPLILMVLNRVFHISTQAMIKQWRYTVLGIFIVAAIFTPPDAFSMLVLAIPLTILYGLSIGLIAILERRDKRHHA